MCKIEGKDYINLLGSSIKFNNYPIIKVNDRISYFDCYITEIEVCFLFITCIGFREKDFFSLYEVKHYNGQTLIISKEEGENYDENAIINIFG